MAVDRFERVLSRQGIILTAEQREAVYDAPIRRLLTVGNPKTLKGRKRGYLTAILHLAPSTASGFNVCPAATAGCAAACLHTAGRGGFDPAIPAARKRRTLQYVVRRADFMSALQAEIAAHCKLARAKGYIPAVRLNGTSDIRFEDVPVAGAPNLMSVFPKVTFYDYTKLQNRRNLPSNYSLTVSAHENMSDDEIVRLTEDGFNVAVVFRSMSIMRRSNNVKGQGILMRRMELPASYCGIPVIDGDESDLRFLDPRGVIVGLRAKGLAVTDSTGFVRDIA